MDITQLQQQIQALPEEAATKPILAGLLQSLESFSSDLAEVRQSVTTAQAQAPDWHGLVHDSNCGDCNAEVEKMVAHGHNAGLAQGRESLLADFDQVFAWANRPDLAEAATTIFEEWVRVGRPVVVGATQAPVPA